MKFLVFYHSTGFSNSAISSTKEKLKKQYVNELDVEFINLDKRNYKKYLDNLTQLPTHIFLWEDDIVENYIKNNYPNIKVLHYEDTVQCYFNGQYDTVDRKYFLLELLLNVAKNNTKRKVVYVLDKAGGITGKEMTEYEVMHSSDRIFSTRKEAGDYCIDELNAKINTAEKELEEAEEIVIKSKAKLKMYSERLKKYL